MLTVTQVAHRLNRNDRYVRRLIEAGKLKATQVNARLWLIAEKDVVKYEKTLEQKQEQRP